MPPWEELHGIGGGQKRSRNIVSGRRLCSYFAGKSLSERCKSVCEPSRPKRAQAKTKFTYLRSMRISIGEFRYREDSPMDSTRIRNLSIYNVAKFQQCHILGLGSSVGMTQMTKQCSPVQTRYQLYKCIRWLLPLYNTWYGLRRIDGSTDDKQF